MKHFKKIAHSFFILIACCIIFSISLYWIFSSTLLTPAFFDDIINNEHAVNSIDATTDYMVQNGIIIERQTLKDNLLSLIGGLIRYITQEDMSFSDIAIDNGNVESLRSSILSGTSDKTHNIPDISRIHPYMLSYFISGSETIYSWLHIARNSYTLYHALSPVLGLFTLFIFLLTEKPGKHISKAFSLSAFSLVVFGLLIKLLQNPLLISPIESVSPDLVILSEHIISKITVKISLYFFITGIIFFAAAMVFRLQPVYNMQNKVSKKITVFLIFITIVFFMLYRHDMYSSIIHNVENVSQIRQISTLAQNDGAVHSLVLKLKEHGSDRPVKDVKLVVNKIDYPYNPLYVSALSDTKGDTRFILPHGSFLVYADETTLPLGLIPFEPVIIQLDNPGNSWYTIYLTKAEKPIVPPVIQSGKLAPYPY